MSNNRIWKPVRGKEDWAEIRSDGFIHYFPGKSKKYPDDRWTWGSEKSNGYLSAGIGGESKGVHEWVYLTFIGLIPKGLQVNHIDENKHNNRVENLNLMTPKQNSNWGTGRKRMAAKLRGRKFTSEHKAKLRGLKRSDETKMRISSSKKGKLNTKCSKAVEALDPVTLKIIYDFPSMAEAGRNGYIHQAVSSCCNNCFNKPGNNIYKGLLWRYKENAQEQ